MSFKNISGKVGIQVHLKGHNTIISSPSGTQEQGQHHSKSGVIYRYKCDRLEHGKEYLGGL